MIKENQRLFNQLHTLSDGVIAAIAMVLAYLIRFPLLGGQASFPVSGYLWLAVFAGGFTMLLCAAFGLYVSQRTRHLHREAQTLLAVVFTEVLLLFAAFFVFRLEQMSRWMLVLQGVLLYIGLLLKRIVLRLTLRSYRARGFNLKHILLIGDGALALEYLTRVKENPSLGLHVFGCVTEGAPPEGIKRLGGYSDLEEILNEHKPDEAVLCITPGNFADTDAVIAVCEKCGIKLSLLPYYAHYLSSAPQIDDVGGLPLIGLRRIPLDNLGNAFLKRSVDIIGSFALLILTSPLLLVTAIGVKISSPGPILFAQERVGRDQKPFRMYKFRSMRINDRSESGWSSRTDSRRTPFGSFIRKFSIDELPQFVNVLLGDMSLVGPRPEVPYFVERFREEIPRYMVKHQVRPGITGWAQVNGWRGDTSIRRRIECDIYYIENWSIFFDLKILFLTLTKFMNDEELKNQQPEADDT